MRPDFYDDLEHEEISTEIEIEERSLSCKSRYIFVFELFSEEEVKKCEECKKYNDKIQLFDDIFIPGNSNKTRNEYLMLNGLGFPDTIRKNIERIIIRIETINKHYNKSTKRIYILDTNKDLKLVYAAKIAKSNIKDELEKILNILGEELANKEKENYISINSIQKAIIKQTHLDKSVIKIENINSTIINIPQEAIDLVNIVANDDEIINNSFDITVRLNHNNSFYRWCNFLLSQIKVYLVRKEDMPTMEEYIRKYELEENDIYKITRQTSIPRTLGRYYRNPRNIEGKEVKICICPELIENFADSIGIDKNIAYAKVIVHELAHAMMDEQNVVSLDNDKPYLDHTVSNDLSFNNPYFRFVMEESVANCITLIKFNASSLENFDIVINDVIKFIEHQPEAYKFGVKQFDAKVKACKWRTMKDKITQSKAEEWLEKYFVNNEPYSAEAFDKLFK